MIVFLYKVIMVVMARYYTLMPAVERGLMRVWYDGGLIQLELLCRYGAVARCFASSNAINCLAELGDTCLQF